MNFTSDCKDITFPFLLFEQQLQNKKEAASLSRQPLFYHNSGYHPCKKCIDECLITNPDC